ncbi:MAG: hypothetical protein K5884_11675 [Ruminococcus sp.]|nr:hypothetical protein [Ruminococcus sp.]
MRKNILGRLTAFTMALAVVCGGAVSCGNSDKSGKTTASPKTSGGASNEAEQAKANVATSLKAEPIDIKCEFDGIGRMVRIPDSDKIVVSGYKNGNYGDMQAYITDTSFTELKKLDIKLDDTGKAESYTNITAASDGTLLILQTINDYGDMEAPDEYDEDFDYEAYEEARETSYKFYNVDLEGNIISKRDMDDLAEHSDVEDFYADSLISFGKDKAILSISGNDGSSKIIAIDMKGNIIDEVDADGLQYVFGASETSDGKFVLAGYTSMGMKVKYFDTEGMKPEGKEIELQDTSMYNITDLVKGDDEYTLYASTMSGLYGIKEDGSSEEKVNWSDCDLDSSGETYVIPVDNGEYVVYNQSYEESGPSGGFYRLVERDASELENTKIITIGTLYDDYQVAQQISKFNKAHDDIRIKAVNYEKYDDYDEETEKINNTSARQLKMDIVAGKAPDMIVSYDTSVVSSLAGKDVFADLYEFMDDDLKKEDILDNVLAASEINGKLLSLSPTFYINTVACKTKYCDIENWTFEDMKKTYESLPDGMGLCEIDSNEAVLQLVLPSLSEYVDYSTSSCNFNTPEFKEMVEFCAQFPDTEDIIDWKNASDDEMNEYMNDIESKYKEDRALLSTVYLGEFREYKRMKDGTFADDITLVGTPSDDGQGAKMGFNTSFSILDSSDAKAECWEFIKEFFTEDAYKDAYQFPVVKKEFEKQVDGATKKRTYTDEDGKEHEIDDTYYINGKEIKIDPLTEDEKKFIVDYVKNVKSANIDLSDEVYEIGNECLKSYFKGEKSLDEAIELLQSKVSILLSEQS